MSAAKKTVKKAFTFYPDHAEYLARLAKRRFRGNFSKALQSVIDSAIDGNAKKSDQAEEEMPEPIRMKVGDPDRIDLHRIVEFPDGDLIGLNPGEPAPTLADLNEPPTREYVKRVHERGGVELEYGIKTKVQLHRELKVTLSDSTDKLIFFLMEVDRSNCPKPDPFLSDVENRPAVRIEEGISEVRAELYRRFNAEASK